MKRILVVPDIHGRTFWKEPVEKYIDRVDRIVFLGPNDIFDQVLQQFYGGERCGRTLRMLNIL